MFRNIRVSQIEERLSHGSLYKDHDLVFAYSNGEPIRVSYYSQGFSKLVKQIKGLPHVSFHGLRHLHATLLLQQGIHPKVVSERLGHKSIDITMNLYSHVMPNMQKEAVQKLDNLFFPKQHFSRLKVCNSFANLAFCGKGIISSILKALDICVYIWRTHQESNLGTRFRSSVRNSTERKR